MRRGSPAPWVLAVTLLAAGALASVAWTTTSQITVASVAPPIKFVAGDNADNPRYMRSFELSQNATSFTAEIRPRTGAEMRVQDIIGLDNTGGPQAYNIRLSATQVTNPNIEGFTWDIYDGTTLVATLDYRVAQPEATFSLPAGVAYRMDLFADLADGSGRTNAGISFDLQLEVTP